MRSAAEAVSVRAALALLALALPALAAGQQPYAAMRLGAAAPQHPDLAGFDRGVAAEAAAGLRLHENLAIELSAGRFAVGSSSTSWVRMGSSPDAFTTTVTFSRHLAVHPVLVTARLLVPVGGVELGILGGAGAYSVSGEEVVSAYGERRVVRSANELGLGGHGGASVAARLAPGAQVGLEVRYVVGSVRMYGATTRLDAVLAFAGMSFVR